MQQDPRLEESAAACAVICVRLVHPAMSCFALEEMYSIHLGVVFVHVGRSSVFKFTS